MVLFGSYPHTASGSDKTPIQWRILQAADDALFLLSAYIIDGRPYHNEAVATTWRDCDLRRWLNHDFLNSAFSPAEQQRIRLTVCGGNGAESPDTTDRLFLLSVAEIKALTSVDSGPMQRRTLATAYAQAKHADGSGNVYVYDKGVEQDYIRLNGEKHGCSWWWTRTQLQIEGGRSARAAFIGPRSNIKSYGKVDLRRYGVRPALILEAPFSPLQDAEAGEGK